MNMAYKIIHRKDECIACGVCAAVCPDNWEMGDDGFAKPINEVVEELGCNQEAKDSCPVGCIDFEEI